MLQRHFEAPFLEREGNEHISIQQAAVHSLSLSSLQRASPSAACVPGHTAGSVRGQEICKTKLCKGFCSKENFK